MNTSCFHVTRLGLIGTVAYPLVVVVLYFSLALHLHLALGKWPESIGIDPGTPLFHAHAWAARALFWLGFILLPVATVLALIFVVVERTRRWAVHLLIFIAACLVAFGAMQLAPSGFTNWWWD